MNHIFETIKEVAFEIDNAIKTSDLGNSKTIHNTPLYIIVKSLS